MQEPVPCNLRALAQPVDTLYPAIMRTESVKHLMRKGKRPLDPGGVLLDDVVSRGRVDLAVVFGNARPVEVEIGVGKGAFLLSRAPARPEINLLGIEYTKSYAVYSADRVRRADLANVRIAHCDAVHFVTVCLDDGSLRRVHIYFPDPWPKRRHHRRRLIQPRFIGQIQRVLQPGGQLIIVTDHQDYFRQIQQVVTNASGFASIRFPRAASANAEIAGTNYERKYAAQGRPFYCIARMRYDRTTGKLF
ncbi:MAG: tRNA (guanosine(46)-N7)-methyltransferase TrmB [Phycisphaerae bacterium]|nr:tRNA (guanosine(46)-N7)-methyltransferase TrmB [Phycisphaerae bacterium]